MKYFWNKEKNLEYSDYCLYLYCYMHNVSTDLSFVLFQMIYDDMDAFL